MNAPPPTSRRAYLFVAALLALHYVLAVASKCRESTTSDELVHITGGFVFNHFDDYRIHPENGILPQRFAALPTTLIGSRFPPLDTPSWRTSNSWVLGHQFFYEQPGQDHFPRLMAGRALIALFSVATGVLVFLWSRALFGPHGALVSLVLFAFSPTFLAHGALATSDVCMGFFMLASVGAWWRQLHCPIERSRLWWWLSAVTFGLACVAKFSAPLLVPIFVVLAVVRAWSPAPLQLFRRSWNTRAGKIGAAALSALGHGAVAVLIIWAFFGFRYSAFNPALPPADHFIRPWAWLDQNLGGTGRAIRTIAALRLLPEGYLYGLAYVLETAQVRSAFLNGGYSTTGWATFFVWAFLFKTTLALLVAAPLALILIARRALAERSAALAMSARILYRLAPLAALFVIYWLFSVTSHLNIGHRHILPTYPVLFIACGALGVWLDRTRPLLLTVVVALAAWQGFEALRAYPDYLAYFNVLGGEPRDRHRHLVDSSLDWGQDLPGLKRWLDAHAAISGDVYLSYFGTGEPDYYRIAARRLPFVNGFKLPKPPIVHLTPGVYCISATMLEHVYSTVRGAWTLEFEREFLAARAHEPDFIAATAGAADEDTRRAADRYELLRFARLCHYLRARRPDADIGSSILIYRLSQAEVDAAVYGSLREWAAALERAINARDK